MSLMTAQLANLREFLDCGAMCGKPGGKWYRTLNSGHTAESLGRLRQLELTGQNSREVRIAHRKNRTSLQRVPFEYSPEYSIRTCM